MPRPLPNSLVRRSTADKAMLGARMRWVEQARPNQLTPPGDDWDTWVVKAGRGFGKTRIGAEDASHYCWRHPGHILHAVGPTSDDVRGTMFEGESGLLAVVPPECVLNYNRNFHELTLVNGSLIRGFSAEAPERMRGPQCHRGWLDELGAWQKPILQEAYDMYTFGARLGEHVQTVVTTTPKPLQLLRAILKDKRTVLTGGSTYENAKNLSRNFLNKILKYEGTKLGRQEIHAEILEAEEDGIFARSDFPIWPYKLDLPRFEYVIASFDTAFTEKTQDKKTGDFDPSACTVWGVFSFKEFLPPELMTKYDIKQPFGVMLLRAWSDYLSMPDLMVKARNESNKTYGRVPHRPDLLLIEGKGSGISLRQHLEREGVSMRMVNPGREGKTARAHGVSHFVAHRLVWVPESSRPHLAGQPRDWVVPFLDQVCAFNGERFIEHDDYVDTMTQVLGFLGRTGYLQVKVVKTREFADSGIILDDEPVDATPVYDNPYGTGGGMHDNPYVR